MELYAPRDVWFQKLRKKMMDCMTQPPRARPRKEQADREIDENLKRAFNEVASQQVPDRFTELLEQLRKQETQTPSGQSEEAASDD